MIQLKDEFKTPNKEYNEMMTVAAWLHELGHWIEYHNAEVRAMCNAFLEYRTQGNEKKHLPPPNEDKEYKEGGFPCKYCGVIAGDWTDSRCTEILSQGLEMLIMDSEKSFNKDHEYFSFIVNILKGNIIDNDELKIDKG